MFAARSDVAAHAQRASAQCFQPACMRDESEVVGGTGRERSASSECERLVRVMR